jgi:hypothetical protein
VSFKVMTSTLPKGTLGSVASLLAATLYQGNPDRNHKLWNIPSSERDIHHRHVLLGVAANKEATEPRVPFGNVEVITSKILRSPP